MSKFKLFVENFVIYGLGGTISKIIPFIMLPVVTRLMPNTAYYGISDLSVTLVSLCSALAVMGMYDAMFRMFFEEETVGYREKVCSTALVFTSITSFIMFSVLLFLHKWIAIAVLGNGRYQQVVLLTALSVLVGATNSIVSAPTRMQNKRVVYLVMNTISSLISYAISIPLLLKGYYLIALPLAAALSAATIELIFWILNRKWFQLHLFDRFLLKQLLVIALPLLPNFLIYWIFNSCDRLMIAKILGNSFTGIYSIGAKLGQCSQLIYTAFAGGWQFFAFSTMKEKNQVKTNSLIFEYLGIISFVAGIFIMALCQTIFKILFTGDYLQGYIVAPYLFMAPLLQMLFQVACNQFLVIKKTWPNMLILSSGAIINILINLYLIPVLGIEGAALATLLGYVISDIICVVVLYKMKLMTVSCRFLGSTMLFIVFFVMWRVAFRDRMYISLLFAVLVSVCYLVLYRKELLTVKDKITSRK